MSIQEHLNKIRNAIYGREVRESIAKGIETAYDDASEKHDNANMEVKIARGTHPNLRSRLEEVDNKQQQIDQKKANKSEVEKKANKELIDATNKRVDELIIGSGNANAEVTDAHVSAVKNKTFPVIGKRIEDIEKDTFFPIKNYIKNSKFSDALGGSWNIANGTTKVEDENLTVTSNENAGSLRVQQKVDNFKPKVGDKLYVRLRVKLNNSNFSNMYFMVRDWIAGGTFIRQINFDLSKIGEWQEISTVVDITSDFSDNLSFYVEGLPTDVGSFTISRPLLIDLTETFGSGYELKTKEIEKLLSKYTSTTFNGTINLFNADRFFWDKLKNENLLDEINNNYFENLVLDNLIKNHDFKSLDHWGVINGSVKIIDGYGTVTGDGSRRNSGIEQFLEPKKNHRYYIKVRVRVLEDNCEAIQVLFNNTNVIHFDNPKKNEWQEASVIYDVETEGGGVLRVRQVYKTEEETLNSVLQVDKVLAVDLTDNLGKDYEVSHEEVNEIINLSGKDWFENTAKILSGQNLFKWIDVKEKQLIEKNNELQSRIESLESNGGTGTIKNENRIKKMNFGSSDSIEDIPYALKKDNWVYDDLRGSVTETVKGLTFSKHSDSVGDYFNFSLDLSRDMRNKNIAMTLKASEEIEEISFMGYCGSQTNLKFREGISGGGLRDFKEGDTVISLNPMFLGKENGTQSDLADFRRLVIRITLKENVDKGELLLREFKIAESIPAPGVIALVFDDALESQYAKAYNKMKEYNMVGSIGVITGFIDNEEGYCTTSQLQEMYSSGWDMNSHTVNHRELGRISNEDLKYEVVESQQWLADNGFTKSHRHLIYPGTNYSSEAIEEVQKYYLSARASETFKGSYPVCERYKYGHALYVTRNHTLADFKRVVDRVAEFGGLCMISFHDIVDELVGDGSGLTRYDCQVDLFEEVIDYINESNVPTVTISDLFEWGVEYDRV